MFLILVVGTTLCVIHRKWFQSVIFALDLGSCQEITVSLTLGRQSCQTNRYLKIYNVLICSNPLQLCKRSSKTINKINNLRYIINVINIQKASRFAKTVETLEFTVLTSLHISPFNIIVRKIHNILAIIHCRRSISQESATAVRGSRPQRHVFLSLISYSS